MADNMLGVDVQWLSAELRILEAEYEKSKLQVFQDTLLCKRYMIELDLLCKNEQLRKNTRVNNKIKEHEFELQEQMKSLSTELENATIELRTVQNTLQDEKTQHDVEKRELEEKLSLQMEKRMEEQKKSAGHRENLLQEEIKNLQDKQATTFREAEGLRMELRRKNVPVKAKAVQTRVTAKDASTMSRVDSQTSDVGVQVQVQESASDEAPRMNSEDIRKVDGTIQEKSESGKGGKAVAEVKRRNNKRQAKDGDEEIRLGNRNGKANKKGKEGGKGEERGKDIAGEREKNTRSKASKKGKSSAIQEEGTASPSKVIVESATKDRLHDRRAIGNALLSCSDSQDDGVPLQYSKTPRQRKKSDQSLENSREKSVISTAFSDDAPSLITETVTSIKESELTVSEGIPQTTVCRDENGNNRAAKGNEEGRETGFVEKDEQDDEKDSTRKTSSQQQIDEEQQNHFQMEDDMEEKGEGACEPKKTGAGRTGREVLDKKSKRTAKKKERTMKEKTENKKAKKTKAVGASETEISHDKNRMEKEKSERRIQDENIENKNRRVLRSRSKKRNRGVETDPCKCQGDDVNNKSFAKKSRQMPCDSDGASATKKCKTDDTCSRGHEPAMLLTSSPEDHRFRCRIELSSSEIDTLVDEPRPSPGVTTRATCDDSSQQPETEMQDREGVRDYSSGQGSLVLDDNRIKEIGEKINSGSLHSTLDGVKSKKSSSAENNKETSNRVENNGRTTEISSKKCRISKRILKKGGDSDDAGVSRRQDSSAVFRDNDTRPRRHKDKSTTSDRGHSSRRGQNRTGQPTTVSEKTDATLKENAPNGKSAGKKRKPKSSVRKVLAPADQQSSADSATSAEISSMLDNAKKRKTLFNARENSLMVSASKVQISFANTTLSKGRTNTGIPPSLSAFMRSFIAPKLKKSL